MESKRTTKNIKRPSYSLSLGSGVFSAWMEYNRCPICKERNYLDWEGDFGEQQWCTNCGWEGSKPRCPNCGNPVSRYGNEFSCVECDWSGTDPD